MEKDGVLVTESHLRSLIKAISWRVWGTVVSIIVSYLLTHEIKIALAIGFVEFFSKILLYYTHERIWDYIPWGMKTKVLSSDQLKKYTK